jgi:hypothetical protein
MCLLIMPRDPRAPLVVAANVTRLESPTLAMTAFLRAPRIEGRDERAWNGWRQASRGSWPDCQRSMIRLNRAKRSRGELPPLARLPGALEAACAQASIRSEEFNPCWMLCGDRDAPSPDLSSGRPRRTAAWPESTLRIARLVHRPNGLRARALRPASGGARRFLTHRLESLLASHEIPPAARKRGDGRPPETGAACVHAGPYGTRSAQIVIVPDRGAPRIRFTAGPSCEHPWQDLPAELQYPS